MYILTQEPTSGQRLEAFNALDDAFGTESFTQGQAITVIENALGEDGTRIFQDLVNSGCVSEVD
jgi:hypothetical protein